MEAGATASVTGVAQGTVTIAATSAGKTGTATIVRKLTYSYPAGPSTQNIQLVGTYRVNGNDLTLSWVNGNFDLTWVWKIVSDRELQAPFSYQGSDLATKTTVATFRK